MTQRLRFSVPFSFLLVCAATFAGCGSSGDDSPDGDGDSADDGGTGGHTASGGSLGTGGSGDGDGDAAGGSSSGGSASGGSDGTGGGGFADLTAQEIVEEMHLGWNLGNTLDADDNETAWGNPETTQAMIDAVHDAGFNTVRIPVTWMHHMGGAPDYTIDEGWMNRVEEVVGYVLQNDMYAILNTHHDSWVSVMPDADQDAIRTRLGLLWTQIATRFRDYDEHLIFETLNEPRTTDETEWSGGTPAARSIINTYNLAAVNAIRATGGNNSGRFLMVPTHAANPSDDTIAALVIPNNDPNIIVSLHTYYPYELSLGDEDSWGSASDIEEMEEELDRIYNLLPAQGRAVVIGEWGTQHRNNTAVRALHAETYARLVRERGMCSVWWDNGALSEGADGFGLLDRDASPPTWAFPTVVQGLAAGATAGAAL